MPTPRARGTYWLDAEMNLLAASNLVDTAHYYHSVSVSICLAAEIAAVVGKGGRDTYQSAFINKGKKIRPTYIIVLGLKRSIHL